MPTLAWNDWIEDPTTTLSSTSSFVSTLPLSNLKDSRLAVVARKTAGSGISITATFPSLRPVGLVAMLNCSKVPNVGFSRFFLRNGATVVATLTVNSSNWPNILTRNFPNHLFGIPSGPTVCDSIEFQSAGPFYDTAGALSFSEFSAGRFWASEAWTFNGVSTGFQSNWAMPILDKGSTLTSVGGQKYHQRRRRPRRLDLAFKALDVSMILGVEPYLLGSGLYYPPCWTDFANDVGTTKDLIVIPRDSVIQRAKTALYGSVVEFNGPTHTKGELFDVSFKVEETF
jgi:hypothetical protein